MALGDKVAELQQTAATLTERLDTTVRELKKVVSAHKRLSEEFADLRRTHEREIALLRREVEAIKNWTDDRQRREEESSRRLWAFGPNVLSALISSAIAAVVAYFVARR